MEARSLPVYEQKQRILDALADSQVVVVESPTGSGKTTQLPLILHEAGYSANGLVGVTQPRRIAAVSVSSFIARQTGGKLGDLVGYKMRFEDTTTPSTRLKIMTDGILLQEMKLDYTLSQYSVIVVDEAHERSLNIDFILGLLKRVLAMRRDFKVVISSATINAEVFSEYFDGCPVVRIETQMYPVATIYDPPPSDDGYDGVLFKITQIIGRIIEEKREGDVLIFLSGEKMIKDCTVALLSMPYRRKLHILPLYARLSKEEQDAVFPPAPSGRIKVVIATNIAETSLTIDGITTVIDSGLAKMNFYNHRTFTASLIEGPISKASANQRRGRAGRTRPGTCYRLYEKDDFETRPLFTLEEIYRTDLSEVVLRMAELGIDDFESFDFISSPGRQGIVGAVETLELLEALTPENALSPIGKMMAVFPLLPRHSRIIVEAIRAYPDVLEEAVIATAFLTTNTPFLLPQGEEMEARRAHHQYQDVMGDFVSYLKLFRAYTSADQKDKEKFCERRYLDPRAMAEIKNVVDQLAEIVGSMGVPVSSGGSVADYLCAVSKGLIQFICVRSGRNAYRSVTAEKVMIHPSSVMFRETPRFIVAGEIVRTTRMYARSVSPLEKEWLPRISPALARTLAEPTGAPAEKKARDTSWQIKIGTKFFKLQPYKGKKKIAVLLWEDLEDLLRSSTIALLPQHNNIRGKVVYQNYELLSGNRLSTIMKIVPHVNLRTDVLESWPRKKSYDVAGSRPELCLNLGMILKLARTKKSSRSLGFLALHCDNAGLYWFKPMRDFHTAASESLATIERLVDDLADDADQSIIDMVNDQYRRLAQILEEA